MSASFSGAFFLAGKKVQGCSAGLVNDAASFWDDWDAGEGLN